MVNTFDVNDVLYELSDNVVAVLGAVGGGVSVADSDGRLSFITSTSKAVVAMEKIQERDQAGPCVEAFITGRAVAIPEIAMLDRWSDYCRVADQVGFRAVLGLPLAVGSHRIGSLNVYDDRPRHWSAEDNEMGACLAEIATAFIVRAGDLTKARQLSTQLQSALDSRIIIEQAKGMLARQHSLRPDEAFEIIRTYSRNTNTPIRSVTEAIVHFELDLPPA